MILPLQKKNFKIPNSSTGKELGWLSSVQRQRGENSMLASHRRVDRFGPRWGCVGGNVGTDGADGHLSANFG